MIQVLVVDDSTMMVRLLSELINDDPDLHVIGSASNGNEALQQVRFLHPDVITMDVNMPQMDGLRAVELIMSTAPTPIIMISSLTKHGAAATIQALDLGAIDFVSKPSGYISLDIGDLADEIIAKIKLAAKIRVVRTVKRTVPSASPMTFLKTKTATTFEQALRQSLSHPPNTSYHYSKVVTIGCSTGGPQALNEILRHFPTDFPAPILVVQHMPEKFTAKLAALLDSRIHLGVVEAKEGMKLQKSIVYIAPGAYHMKIQGDRRISLMPGKTKTPVPCPSVDILMKSVADVFGGSAIGVILTGMGNDGVVGMNAIKDARGATIAQDEETSLVYGMPKMAIESGCIDSIVPLKKVAKEIIELVQPKNSTF